VVAKQAAIAFLVVKKPDGVVFGDRKPPQKESLDGVNGGALGLWMARVNPWLSSVHV